MRDAMDRVERALNDLRLEAKDQKVTIQRIDVELARVKGYIEGH